MSLPNLLNPLCHCLRDRVERSALVELVGWETMEGGYIMMKGKNLYGIGWLIYAGGWRF